jgi:DNA modification methylase
MTNVSVTSGLAITINTNGVTLDLNGYTISSTPQIPENSVSLVVTSPPFLDVVQYAEDNWLRCWFAGIDPKTVKLTVLKQLGAWQTAMTEVFRELHRVLKPAGHLAFEVGEVHGGKTKLEQAAAVV